MFKRHLIRLLRKSALTSVKTYKISPLPNRNHILCLSDISSLKCCAPISQFNISLFERGFSSDSKVEMETQVKDTKPPDTDDIPCEQSTQKIKVATGTQTCEEDIKMSETEAENANLNMETQTEFKPTVFMRGLPYSVKEEEIAEFFGPLGIKPTKITVKSDRFGYTNGKAEVEFETEDEADKAMKKQNHYIGNRYIELSLEPFPQMNADRAILRQRGYDDFRDPFNAGTGFMGYTVKLSGLPYDATAEDVGKFFENLNIKPIEINLKYSVSGQALGLCFVKFKTREEALEAMKNDNEYIGNRYIRVTMMRSSQGRMQFSGGMYDDNRNYGRFNDGIKTFEN